MKRLGAELERLSGHDLQNSASNYECELRITENKQGQVQCLFDFTYDRRQSVQLSPQCYCHIDAPGESSGSCFNCLEYLADDADVLDPFLWYSDTFDRAVS